MARISDQYNDGDEIRLLTRDTVHFIVSMVSDVMTYGGRSVGAIWVVKIRPVAPSSALRTYAP